MQCSIAGHVKPRFKVNGCAHGSSIAWHGMPHVKPMAVCMAAASLGTGCLASTQSMTAGLAAATLGTWCLALYQLLQARQHRLAHDVSLSHQGLRTWRQHRLARDASLCLNGCKHGGSSTWCPAPYQSSLGTGCLASTQWLHAWRQHRIWHLAPRFGDWAVPVSVAACKAASLGI